LPAAARRVFATGGSGGAPTDFDRRRRRSAQLLLMLNLNHTNEKNINRRNSLDNSAIIKQFFQAAKKTAIASLLNHCLRKYRSKWQVLRLLLLVTELADELKYDIVVPLTTSVELYQFFQSDVVIFVEKSNDDNVLLLSSHGNCSGRFTNNISTHNK